VCASSWEWLSLMASSGVESCAGSTTRQQMGFGAVVRALGSAQTAFEYR
jgi:hypothetical protein